MRRHDGGFTLVEALVALALTLIVVSASVGTFNQSVRVADTTRTVSETNQALQVAMSLMVRDLIQTGQGIPLGGIPLPSGAGSNPVARPSPPNTALMFPSAGQTLPALSPGADLGPILLGVQTDIITILYADRTLPLNEFPLVDIAGNGNNMTVDNRTDISGPDGLRPGDLILFSNPLGTALRMVTHTPGGQMILMNPNDPLGLNQPNAAQGALQNLQTAPNTYPPTTATRVVMISYYIDAVTDPTLPNLMRQVNASQPLAIARGVENLQFTFDLVDGTFNPTNVSTPPLANSANQIRKVNLFIASRSLDPMPGGQVFFRNSMATQVSLRSLSFVDRYQ